MFVLFVQVFQEVYVQFIWHFLQYPHEGSNLVLAYSSSPEDYSQLFRDRKGISQGIYVPSRATSRSFEKT